ncbi:hypothetical protein [Nocardioides sp. P5_C9_2]
MDESRRRSPDPRWLGAGLLLGAAAGLPVGALWGLLIFLLPGQPVAGLVIGSGVGLALGAIVGLAVGCLVAVVVGRGRPRAEARRRATTVGLLATPVLVVGVLALAGLPVGSWAAPLLVMAAGIGAMACRWSAAKISDRPGVVRR